MIDCHVHSSWSDGKGSLDEVIRMATDKGLKVLGIADHGPNTKNSNYGVSLEKLEDYFEEIENYKKMSSIKLLSGLEVDYSIEDEAFLKRVLPKIKCDFLLGSIHKINYDGRWISIWDQEQWNSTNVAECYFSTLKSAIKSGLFDGIAHPEMVLRNTDVDLNKFEEIIELCSDYKVAFEINVSGFTKEAYDQKSERMTQKYKFPNKDIIKRVLDANLDILIGSDAHEVKHVGGNIDLGIALLKSLDIHEVSYFENRKKFKFQI